MNKKRPNMVFLFHIFFIFIAEEGVSECTVCNEYTTVITGRSQNILR